MARRSRSTSSASHASSGTSSSSLIRTTHISVLPVYLGQSLPNNIPGDAVTLVMLFSAQQRTKLDKNMMCLTGHTDDIVSHGSKAGDVHDRGMQGSMRTCKRLRQRWPPGGAEVCA